MAINTLLFLYLHKRSSEVVTPHTQYEWGKVIGVGAHIYICTYIYIFVDQNIFNRTLAIEPFQTFAVGLSSNL